jgi:hypothetical protein
MKEKNKIIKQIKNADISQDGWEYDILQSITDKHAQGYIESKIDVLTDSMTTDSEDFREELLDIATWNIWGK